MARFPWRVESVTASRGIRATASLLPELAKARGAREKKSKAKIESIIVDALGSTFGGAPRTVEVTRADRALYGANWAATGISKVEDRHESAILGVVTALQGKYGVAW
jgi:hypothetical protein